MRVFSWPLDEYLFILRGQDERGFSSLTKERSFNQRFTSTKRFNYSLWCFSKIFGSPKISTSPFLKATSLIKKRGGGGKYKKPSLRNFEEKSRNTKILSFQLFDRLPRATKRATNSNSNGPISVCDARREEWRSKGWSHWSRRNIEVQGYKDCVGGRSKGKTVARMHAAATMKREPVHVQVFRKRRGEEMSFIPLDGMPLPCQLRR